MNKSNGVSTGVLVVALLLLAAGPLMAEEASQQRPMAYVVCGDGNFQDNRVYRVDLLAGEVKGVSDPLDWMGKPQHLSFDPVHSRLYIASMRGKAADYWPVTVVRVRDSQFEVVNRFTTAEDDTLPRGAGETSRMKTGEPYWSPLNTNTPFSSMVSGWKSRGGHLAIRRAGTGREREGNCSKLAGGSLSNQCADRRKSYDLPDGQQALASALEKG